MQRGSANVWTVHNSRGCFQGPRIISRVEMTSVFNPDGKQPRAYFVGYAHVKTHPDGSIELS
jgi:hypothetical protein